MKKYYIEVTVGMFVAICLICVGYLTIKLGKMEIFGADTYTLTARFNSVAGLREGSSIEIAGVEVGRVSEIRLGEESMQAVVEMKIKKGVEIRDDDIASIKTSGLIGDKYIMITTGGIGDVLKDGDFMIETESALDLEALISKYAFGKVE